MVRSASALLLVLAACTPRDPEGSGEPENVSVTPDRCVAGEYGTWTVSYRVQDAGIRTGGGLRVQLPDSWHAGDRNSANPLQAGDPKADHYISARCSRPGVRLKTEVESETRRTLVKSPRVSIDKRNERYVYVVRVSVTEGELKAGDTVSVVYGDTSGGSRGMRGAIISTRPEPVLVAVDPDGGGKHTLVRCRPTVVSTGGPAAELLLTGPSTLVAGKPATLHLSFVDANANPAGVSWEKTADLRVLEGAADVPPRVPVERNPWAVVKFTPKEPGLLRLEATAGPFRARSNPMRIHAAEPELKIYWGDLHSHTKYSWDGVGDTSFEYARYVSGLDFYAMTDHSIAPTNGLPRGLAAHVWKEYTALTDRHHDPGAFVTIHAYEASFRTPYGHHNVYFRGEPGPLLAPGVVTLPELWRRLTAGQALTIPHHTGKFPRVTWDARDPERRRNFEIYSAHGLSEAYDPAHPLAFEQSTFTSPSRSRKEPSFAQDAWIAGLTVSAIAASDDHRSHPGQPHWGLAAVRASELSREGIFEGLYHRRTYATTGARILLEFTVDGAPMGQSVTVKDAPRLRVEAHGTAPIELLEVLRWSRSEEKFRTAFTLRPGKADVTWEETDPDLREDSVYYMRLRQAGKVRDRIAMAWSSPVWVRRDGSK